MNAKQWQWLLDVAKRIPRLIGKIEQGSIRADTTLGERVIDGKLVQLSFVAEVVDPGADPLASHASVNYPSTHTPISPGVQVKNTRKRRRPKRW